MLFGFELERVANGLVLRHDRGLMEDCRGRHRGVLCNFTFGETLSIQLIAGIEFFFFLRDAGTQESELLFRILERERRRF